MRHTNVSEAAMTDTPLPSPVSSTDHAADSAAEGHSAEGEGKINIFDPADIPLGVWSIVVFVILLFVLKKYAWGPILQHYATLYEEVLAEHSPTRHNSHERPVPSIQEVHGAL